jgi:Ca2+-binding RTX toxin-like protein
MTGSSTLPVLSAARSPVQSMTNLPVYLNSALIQISPTSDFSPKAATNLAAPEIVVAAGTSAATLQGLIDGAAAGSVIRLEAGHFSFDRTVSVARDDITVIGAGSDKTIIDVKPTLGAEAFRIGQGTESGNFKLAADVATGAKEITLTGAHSFVAGDYVYLSRASTTSFFDSIGDHAWRNTDVPLRTCIAQVAAVHGNVITLASGVKFDFVPGETTVSEISMAEHVKVGGFSVSYGLPPADPSNFSNTMSAYDRNAVIEVKGTAGLNLFDITSHDVPSLGLNVAASIGATVDHITMTGSHNKGDSGNGYGVQIRDVYDSKFTNLSDQDMRHSVVFASWTSSAGNFVHVLQTDRDINFHGGRDHDNVVMVDSSIRDVASDIIGMSVFYNTESTHYGTVTDPTTNITKFGHVVGTRLGDDVHGYDTGSWLEGMGGNDTLTGGAGNDMLTGGAGNDIVTGGAGVDIASFTGARAGFVLTAGSDGLHVTNQAGDHSTDVVNGVEWLLFDDGALRLSDMTFLATSAVAGIFTGAGTFTPAGSGTTVSGGTVSGGTGGSGGSVAPTELTGTAAADTFEVTVAGTIVHGLGGTDVVHSAVTYALPSDVERLYLTGNAAINGTGSEMSDQMHGNSAANILSDAGGNDSLYGGSGDDHLLGGAGNDYLSGGAGNDIIDGGTGHDRLKGNAGADVFVFASVDDSPATSPDQVMDFQSALDKVDLHAIDANTHMAGDQAFTLRAGPGGAGAMWLLGGTLFGDVDGDGVADIAIAFGTHIPTVSDLIL